MEAVGELGASLGSATGFLTETQAQSARSAGKALAKTFEDITPEQEYYIGRAVGAVVLSRYRPYDDPVANAYVNLLGQTLAQASDRPETFGGYHFLMLDSDEVNAFAAPGGLVFVTRGMLACCAHEDALAAVLAHEIGHVQLRHGLKAIKASRLTGALTVLAAEGAKTFGGEELAQLTQDFQDSVSDVTQTLINSGYSRGAEADADAAAVALLQRVGYEPSGLIDMLQAMETRLVPGGSDFGKTHPSPESRIAAVTKLLGAREPVRPVVAARQARFEAALRRG
ncbi:MAG: M48 family metalloprotease [Proteobacteria bacterium]|nr:M48 family metalloprotease [Pseudomonadota bacterium]